MGNTIRCRIGVDIGGTFTDLMLSAEDGRIVTHKVPTTPENYGRAVVDGIQVLLEQTGLPPDAVEEIVHGTTVATNTVLEHKGARTGLLTTRGFRDVLEIRRIRSPEMYNPLWDKPKPIVPRRYRLEVDERINTRGEVERALDLASAEQAIQTLVDERITSVAVCFINSFANPAHELTVGELIRRRFPDLYLSLSCEVLPEIREYERTSTTVINAFLMPTVKRYLRDLEADLRLAGMSAPLLIMQSNGGVMPATVAQERPVHIVESGPAAGVIGSFALAKQLGVANALTFDMGGTTAKASIIENGQLTQANEYEVGGGISATSQLIRGGGYALRVPVIDIAEVGAGGGSIVWIDQGGSLQIGPQSAGAVPGPVCYGHGGVEPTVTDANVVLGYINPAFLCGGEVPIDAERSQQAIADRVARPLGLDLLEAAYGIHLVANSNMHRALRAVSTQRGRDPRGYTLFAFGGNGPVHAAQMARGLDLPRVIVPPASGVFSAAGLLLADVEHHSVRTFFRTVQTLDPADLNDALDTMEAEARATLASEGYQHSRVRLRRAADLRYSGQSFELTVPLPAASLDHGALRRLIEQFGQEHEHTYGHRGDADQAVDIVNLRLITTGIRTPSSLIERLSTDELLPGSAFRVNGFSRGHGRPISLERGTRDQGPGTRRMAYFGKSGLLETPVVARHTLASVRRAGPLIVEEYDTTVVIPPGCTATLDRLNNIVIEIGQ